MTRVVNSSKHNILGKALLPFTFSDEIWIGVHKLDQIIKIKNKKRVFEKGQIARQNGMPCFWFPVERLKINKIETLNGDPRMYIVFFTILLKIAK